MLEILTYGFMQKALLGGIAIAIACGLIGPFLVLRKLSLLGDGLSHLAFGGIALGLLLGVEPLLAGLIAVAVGSLWVHYIMKKDLYGDAAIALIISFGFGLGVVIIGSTRGFTLNIFSFIIGSILALSVTDLILIGSVLAITALFIGVFYRQLFMLTFSEEMAQLKAPRSQLISVLFTVIIALVVAISIRAVGILLVSSLIVIPALIALLIAKSFRQTIIYSSLVGIVAMVLGIISSFYLDTPPSGTIVLLLVAAYLLVNSGKKFL